LLKLRDASLILIEEARQASQIKTSFEIEIDLLARHPESEVASILKAYSKSTYCSGFSRA